MSTRLCLTAVLLLCAAPLWSQASGGARPAGGGAALWSEPDSGEPSPAGEEIPVFGATYLSDEGYSLAFASETPRTNYVRGSFNLTTVYDDNLLPLGGPGITDVEYALAPRIQLRQSRSRLRWYLSYSPGFKVYQRNTSLNGVDHDLGLDLEYRLSPRATVKFSESYQKASDLLFTSDISSAPNSSAALVPPATPKIINVSSAELTYQLSSNAMAGAKVAVSGLWYPNRSKLNGFFDSTGGSTEAFYTHRLSEKHYLGGTYKVQRLFTHPGDAETQTQSALLFYTLYLPPRLAISVFAGPEHSDTHSGILLSKRNWSPAAGASVAWHGQRTSMITSYAEQISNGGLAGAVRSKTADASMRWQLAKTWTVGLRSSYSLNRIVDSLVSLGGGGHTVSGTATLDRSLGDHLDMQLGYTRLYQHYPDVVEISKAPNRDSVWFSLAYQFERPLGR
jgi:hypothetical protein